MCCLVSIGCNNNNKDVQEDLTKGQSEQTTYYLKLSAKVISKHEILFNVRTNIPLPVEVMASVDLANQKPEEIYIGYSKKIILQQSNQSFILNVENKDLPNGDYNAKVTFYPRWGAKNGNHEAAKIKKPIHGSLVISLQGNGQTAESVKQKNSLQLWVMENIVIGTPWDKNTFVEKLGPFRELTVTNRNPKIIKAYYFPDADMTIFVNIYKNNIVTWRKGMTSTL